jgi:uncharacterized membrane protein
MINDLTIILNWWFLLFWMGIIVLPITSSLFKNFFDLGYGFSKIIAIALFSYLAWILGSLKILSFTYSNLWLIILGIILFNFFIVKKTGKGNLLQFKKRWKVILTEETIFLLALIGWSFVRGFQPDIEGLEKFMDFGFVNAILKSQYFPPLDMWMSGKTINYYYFGHLVAAVLTKFSLIDSAITYNLMIATIFALVITAGFSLVGNLVHSFNNLKMRGALLAGLVGTLLLSIGGNLHPLWWLLTNKFSFVGYWYPDATRFIVEKFGAADNTIHEFPIYSFVVSDLHGHVSDIPFVLLCLGLIFSLITSEKSKKVLTLKYLFISLILGIMYMTNSWDFPIYLMITGLVVFWNNYLVNGLKIITFFRTALISVLISICSIIFTFPFHLNFEQIAKGIGVVHAHTPPWMFLVLWGYQWVIGLIFILFIVRLIIKKRRIQLINSDYFVIVLLTIATVLIIIPEFVYVKDIYIASYHRANTVFKLVYQSFILYAISVGYIIIRLLSLLKRSFIKLLFLTLIFGLFFPVFVYPDYAIRSYYGELKTYRGLWGLEFLKKSFPDDFAGIEWLKNNIFGQPTILEAVGDSYTNYNRVSMATGLPTVEGWLVHEWLWRGGYDEPGKRAADVQTIYETNDHNIAETLLSKYKVKYIFIGTLEQQKYKVNERKFSTLGKIIFQSGNTKIYLLD